MNCQEVGDLMQRNLDHDLNETELEELMTHLNECMRCSELYERLTLLSGSLKQLPHVTPAFSLVDAILPELDAIDTMKKSNVKVLQNKSKVKAKWYTLVGSVAAAGLVAVTMLIANSYLDQQGAETAIHDVTAENSKQSNLESINEMRNLSTIEPTATDENDIQPIETHFGSTSTTGNQIEQYSTTPPQVKEPSFTMQPVVTTNGSSSVKISSKDTEPEVRPKETLPISTINNIPDDKAERDTTSDMVEITNEQSNEELNEGEGSFGIMEIPSEQTNPNNCDTMECQGDFGILGIETERQYSPNEQYYIHISPGQLIVYAAESDEQVKVITSEGNELRLITWANDSNSFTYEIISTDGQITSYNTSVLIPVK